MKTLILLAICLCTVTTFAQDGYFAKTITDYNEVLNSNKNEIYSLDKAEFDSLIKTDKDHQFHLVYSFATWSKPCLEYLPKLLKWTNSNPSVKLYILNIEKDGSDKLLSVKNFLREKHNFNANTFMVSDEYGKRRWKKYDAFVREMAPDDDEYGLSLLLFYDETGSLLYASKFYDEESEPLRLSTMTNIIAK